MRGIPTPGKVLIILMLSWHTMSRAQFGDFLATIVTVSDSAGKQTLINDYLASHAVPVTEGNQVHFLYRGRGSLVAVPSELNRWNPSRSVMERVPGTDLFCRTDTAPSAGRIEYKLWVDSVWMLDPLNPRTALGGFGPNSELLMPGYRAPELPEHPPMAGTVDTQWIESASLHRRHPVFIYLPPGAHAGLPVIYVTDGGEYLSLGKVSSILDRLISSGRIRPVAGVFVDPRTNLSDPSSTMRMKDYAASSSYLDFLQHEVAPFVESRYGLSARVEDRLILGASMGGLIATYTVLTRPDFIRKCGAQSPAYLQADSIVIKLLDRTRTVDTDLYIQTGTIGDTELESRLVGRAFRERGGQLEYAEFPEGHNWTSWRTHLPDILLHFFPPR